MFVPGSIGGLIGQAPINHPASWYAVVEDKKTGKRWTYWINGSQQTREAIADHVAVFYPNVKVITIDRTHKMPDRILQPVPPEHFQNPNITADGFPVEPFEDEGVIEDPMLRRIVRPMQPVPKFTPPKPLCPPRR